jgi:hypothetical protein
MERITYTQYNPLTCRTQTGTEFVCRSCGSIGDHLWMKDGRCLNCQKKLWAKRCPNCSTPLKPSNDIFECVSCGFARFMNADERDEQ